MVAYNITLNDISPMIQYTGSWIDKHEDGPFVLVTLSASQD